MNATFLRLGLGTVTIGLAAIVGCSHRRQCTQSAQTAEPCLSANANEPQKLPEVEAPKVLPAPEKPLTKLDDPTSSSGTWSLSGRGKPAPRRSFRDITANPAFAHANDYSWLVGELQYLAAEKVWMVRYASLDDNDRFGGKVVLQETRPLTGFKDNQLVRVEGTILEGDGLATGASYRVRSIRAVDLVQ